LNIISDRDVYRSRFSAVRAFKADYFRLMTGDFSVLENRNSKWYYKKIIENADSEKNINLLPALRKIASDENIEMEVRQYSMEISEALENLPSSSLGKYEKLSSAKDNLFGTRLPQTTEILRLLRDNSIESKRVAIFMIGKFKISDMIPEVCECLNITGLETDAFSILQSFGEVASEELIRFYLISSGNINTSKTIMRLLSKADTKENNSFLFSRLWSNSRQLKEVALQCLIDCGFRPSGEDKDRLHQLISEIIGLVTWDLAAKTCLEKNNDLFLLGAMNKEIDRWNQFLFNLLSITYDAASINKIRENLERETVESVNYALEMIDIVIDDSIKQKLVFLLDVIPDEEKLKNLHQFFPGGVSGYTRLLEDIINRDYNQLSLWTKACTLRNMLEIDGDDLAESIAALLFSPEVILQEESAKLIFRTSQEVYKTISQRIPVNIKKRLDNINSGDIHEKELLYEKTRFLADYFANIPEEELLPLASVMRYINRYREGSVLVAENSLIWSLGDGAQEAKVSIHYSEKMSAQLSEFKGRANNSYYLLPLSAVEEFHNQFPEKSYTMLKYIDINEENSV